MPADPFTPPQEMVDIMQGLVLLRAAAIMAGLPEKTAGEFIADVFVRLAATVEAVNPVQ